MNALEIRILEAATWILKVNPQFEYNYFRSEEIRSTGTNNAHVDTRYPLVGADAVVATASKRSVLLKERGIPLISMEEAVAAGSLIYTIPEDSQLDGGAEFQSRGLVDIWEVPAWDTWVTFGTEEFEEFNQHPNVIIGWIPHSVDNLFFSGRAISILDNLGWLKLESSNSFLSCLSREPEKLEFLEIADEEKEEIFNRLRLINGWEAKIEKEVKSNESNDNPIAKPLSDGLLNRIKRWFN